MGPDFSCARGVERGGLRGGRGLAVIRRPAGVFYFCPPMLQTFRCGPSASEASILVHPVPSAWLESWRLVFS